MKTFNRLTNSLDTLLTRLRQLALNALLLALLATAILSFPPLQTDPLPVHQDVIRQPTPLPTPIRPPPYGMPHFTDAYLACRASVYEDRGRADPLSTQDIIDDLHHPNAIAYHVVPYVQRFDQGACPKSPYDQYPDRTDWLDRYLGK